MKRYLKKFLNGTNISESFKTFLLLAIKGYQRMISPLMGPCCRFFPSCSNYAYEAISRYGIGKGGYLALKRILRCHPFQPGGIDPVP